MLVALAVAALAAAGTREEPRQAPASDPRKVALCFRPFESAVSVRWDDEHFYVESDSMPSHPMMVGVRAWNGQVPIPQPYTGENTFRFPLRPRFAERPVSAKQTLFQGAIAVAANGVPIFNPIKQDGRTDTYLAGELDTFGGHAGRADDYHYHIAPVHLAEKIGPGLPLAWALDGFPLMGYADLHGCEPRELDWLNGHAGSDGSYHYHATRGYPYVNGGFRGRVELRGGRVAIQPRARSVRPFTRPVRGAVLTAFERPSDTAWRLEYQLRGQAHSVSYRLLRSGAEFTFTDGHGRSRTETHVFRQSIGNRWERSDRNVRGRGRKAPGQRSRQQ